MVLELEPAGRVALGVWGFHFRQHGEAARTPPGIRVSETIKRFLLAQSLRVCFVLIGDVVPDFSQMTLMPGR